MIIGIQVVIILHWQAAGHTSCQAPAEAPQVSSRKVTHPLQHVNVDFKMARGPGQCIICRRMLFIPKTGIIQPIKYLLEVFNTLWGKGKFFHGGNRSDGKATNLPAALILKNVPKIAKKQQNSKHLQAKQD